MWSPEDPENFDSFVPSDFMPFLDWWEREQGDAIALQVMGAFVEGIGQPYLELLATDPAMLPEWVQTVMRSRLAAQWAYQQGIPLLNRLERGLPGLVGVNYPAQFWITPAQFAEVPPQIRQAFLEGNKFSLGWIKKLSSDARELMGDLMSANTLQNRNPKDAVAILERVLRRDLAGKELGLDPSQMTPEMVQEWMDQATFSTLEQIARRADLIAVTESARMQNLGILSSMEAQSETLCYVMPHAGSCPLCQNLIDGKVFKIQTIKKNLFENFGKKTSQWVPALPQHPRCRHSPLGVPWRFRKVLSAMSGSIGEDGVLLEYYGLPGGEAAFEALGLKRSPWLTAAGKVE